MSESLTTFCTTSDDVVELSTDTAAFGFSVGSVVHFTKSRFNGKVAVVRGSKDGMLWFAVFPSVSAATSPEAIRAPVQTTSCRGREEYIRQYGWMIDDAGSVKE